jgi:hypothetical protein
VIAGNEGFKSIAITSSRVMVTAFLSKFLASNNGLTETPLPLPGSLPIFQIFSGEEAGGTLDIRVPTIGSSPTTLSAGEVEWR